ncbi:MAG: UDP-N-acetylglucosamine 2-epimerase (non-hydrolyzing) [Lentilitoribacter sp.]
MPVKIICVVGTRPEAIKMAPLILALKEQSWADVRVLATAQHRELLDQVLSLFDIHPDFDLDIMQPNQTLSSLTGRLLIEIDDVLAQNKPDVVIAQGDTTTVMTMALACFYHNIPFGHVEAGLRTFDLKNPFPEEVNRVLAGKFARWHFAPTQESYDNLVREGVAEDHIVKTGNTVIDALMMTASKNIPIDVPLSDEKKLILVTSHRRENFGKPFEAICAGISDIATRNANVQILYPVHPNPNIKNTAEKFLGSIPNITLCAPLDYGPFITAMNKAYLIITDSGGVQEEAPSLGKPVLVLRDETERPEAVDEGVVKLVGADRQKIVSETELLLNDIDAYKAMAKGVSPYGDGHASSRIVETLKIHFGKNEA